jgi:hypothetical protein
MVRWGPESLAAVLSLLSACSASSSEGFAPGEGDAAEEASTDASADGDDELDASGPDATTVADAMCSIPGPATGAASTRCTPDGPGSWTCDDASATGWIYSCQETEAGAHPQPTSVGACAAFGAYTYADASYVVALCANPACTPAAQYNGYCSSGTAVACPAFDAAAPGGNCTPSTIGQWSSGDGLPGTLYCCP